LNLDKNIDEKNEKTKKLIENGVEIAGAAVGGALGFLAAGPIGSAAAAAGAHTITKVISHIGSELHDRLLGHRERVRVGATTVYAIESINEKLRSGGRLREDGFFKCYNSNRSSADEIFEGALIQSKTSYEERKIRYIGAFISNVAFNQNISSDRANYFLKLVDRLTYRQLQLLVIINNSEKLNLRCHDLKNVNTSPEMWSLLQEINELHDLSLLRQLNDKQERDMFWGLGAIKPQKMKLTRIGLDLLENFELYKIPDEENKKIAEMLK
jgi:hypothetical protein